MFLSWPAHWSAKWALVEQWRALNLQRYVSFSDTRKRLKMCRFQFISVTDYFNSFFFFFSSLRSAPQSRWLGRVSEGPWPTSAPPSLPRVNGWASSWMSLKARTTARCRGSAISPVRRTTGYLSDRLRLVMQCTVFGYSEKSEYCIYKSYCFTW